HKAQGSEYPAVVIPLATQHYNLLERNLLYTGVTRGRRLVVLVAETKALGMAVGRTGSRTRLTRLAERIREAVGAAVDLGL
ncbi:MAG TPA: ATP-binding domain-containing protein, partial [Chromatiaceae bacterium]|nr:ATP-binding domain-containing protein [Chromatiaceae bacterium]